MPDRGAFIMGRQATYSFKPGEKIGQWKIIGQSKLKKKDRVFYDVICTCGNKSSVLGYALLKGKSSKCSECNNKLAGTKNFRHGKSRTTIHKLWCDIIQRTENPNNNVYRWYGAKGVRMAAEWRDSFELFQAYMGQRPSKKHSIDRINPFGNYEPGNVRWATPKQQANNKRANWLKKQV